MPKLFTNIEKLATRILFAAATAVAGLAVVEAMVNHLGSSLIGHAFSAGRIMEFGAILLLYVVALLLRQIRDRMG